MYPLSKGCFAPRNQWYVAAYSKDVGREPVERWILDEPVVLYRKEDGTAVALDGRCPHRGFPLAAGRVISDNIVCGYHGISFRADGTCAEIPSQKGGEAACRVKAYAVAEVWDWIWIWPGDPSLADKREIPDHHLLGLTDPTFKTFSGWYHLIPGRYMLMHDNLLDLTHVPHLHRTTLGELSETKVPRMDIGPGWISSTFDYLSVNPPDYAIRNWGYTGMVDRFVSVKLLFPCVYVSNEEYRKASENPNIQGELIGSNRHFHAITPATRTSCHYYFAGATSANHPDPEYHEKAVTFVYPTLEEDIKATTLIEAMLQKLDRAPIEVPLRGDRQCAAGRSMFEDAIIAENEGRRYLSPNNA